MSGSLPHNRLGPASYQVSALVTGGMIVAADSANATTVSAATSASVTILGVAGNDAAPIPSQAGSTDTAAGGAPLVDISVLPDYVSVYRGADMHVTYSANCAFGQQLMVSATAGQVTPFTGTTYSQVIGRCTQPGGVVFATNPVGRALIYG